MPTEKVKLLVIGPERSGKSTISNFLAKFRDKPSAEYKPTVALRILEYEAENLNFNKQIGATRGYTTGSSRAAVELWDVSGHHQRYQSCWQSIMKDANGIIFVFNPDIKNQEKELEMWHKSFAMPLKIKDHCCLVLAHYQQASVSKDMAPKMPKNMAKIKVLETTLDNPQQFRGEVDRLVENVVVTRRDAEEKQILEGAQ
eukprot:TRINITY_DN55947_c0_g2_i1.p1 TRINITY_DN55947_c0_g2~~TRINITY_DN55947_c0_g2_i1.p1  ORF type:complete len:200 (-),score=18.95 TRINITY_DN55947_c0_g2_i1:165-764(-)